MLRTISKNVTIWGAAMLIAASASAASVAQQPRSILDGPLPVSKGRNLDRVQASQAAAVAPAMKGHGPMAKAPAKALRGISAKGAAKRASQAVEPASLLLFESFEGVNTFKPGESLVNFHPNVPEGWSLLRGDEDLNKMEQWLGFGGEYISYMYLPKAADGKTAIGVFYGDEYKSEMLITPEVEIPDADCRLSFYWYTVPFYFFVIDQEHFDGNTGKFLRRDMQYDVEVLASVDGGDWQQLFSYYDHFNQLPDSRLTSLDYNDMQLLSLDLADFVGKKVKFAFHYHGTDGNTFYIDAVSVGYPKPTPSFESDLSRLFFGCTPDEYGLFLPTGVEFYPVNAPILFHNTTYGYDDGISNAGNSYRWTYTAAEDGKIFAGSSTDRNLAITYAPDYSKEEYLINNIYPMPELHATNKYGVEAVYTPTSPFLQAGGTTEYDYPEFGHCYFTSFNFDPSADYLGYHVEFNDKLGLGWVPIFGYQNDPATNTSNSDLWWQAYCYPNSEPGTHEGVYCDGFANLFFPNAEAPLVVKGVTAFAKGTITDDAEFTLDIYTLYPNPEDPDVYRPEDEPMLSRKLRGSDVIKISGVETVDVLVMNFAFDEPVLFTDEDTSYGYLVMVSGYHDPVNVSYFSPMMSIKPNEYDYCLGFYRMCNPVFDGLKEEISSLGYFFDDNDDQLCCSFAIGLDGHYPWLDTEDGKDEYTVDATDVTFNVLGYWDASDYTVDAPDWLSVKLDGRYTTAVTIGPDVAADEDRSVDVTLRAPGVSKTIKVNVKAGALGIDAIDADTGADAIADVYNMQGMLVRRAVKAADVRGLAPGIYMHNGRKIHVK